VDRGGWGEVRRGKKSSQLKSSPPVAVCYKACGPSGVEEGESEGRFGVMSPSWSAPKSLMRWKRKSGKSSKGV